MLVDSHCHIDAGEFDADRIEVIERARAAGITSQVVPAITAAGFPALRELCAASDGLHPAYGLHPMFMDAHRPAHLDELALWLERERPVALGECGLDFLLEEADAEGQRR